MWRDAVQGERREYFRVEGLVRLHYRKVEDMGQGPATLEGSSAGQETQQQDASECPRDSFSHEELSEKEILLELLSKMASLEARLNWMQEILSRKLPGPEVNLRPCFVNISGCGMRFPTRERFQVGDQVELSLEFPMTPNHIIRLVGEVVHVLETGDGAQDPCSYQTAVRFVSLSDSDRDQIIRYSLQRQYDFISQARKRD
ncbi:MAG: PilZ domain-containing protein [bacterium]